MIKEDKNNREREHCYEANCLVSLRNEGKIEELAKKMQDWIEKREGGLLNLKKESLEDKSLQESVFWVEKRKLAYPIRKDYFGCYLTFWFNLKTLKIVDFKKFLSLEGDILRFQVFSSEGEEANPTSSFSPLCDLANIKVRDERERINYENRERPAKEETKFEVKPETIVSKPKTESTQVESESEPIEVKIEEEKEKAVEETEIKEVDEVKEDQTSVEVEEEKEEPKVAEKIETIEEDSLPEEKVEVVESKSEQKAEEKVEVVEDKSAENKKDKKKEAKKQKKITLEELDDRLDDILNEEII